MTEQFAAIPRYEAYKDSGIEWLGKIPEQWILKKIAHLFLNVGSGSTPSSGNVSFYGGSIPWLQTGDLTDSDINSTSKTVTEKALRVHSTLKKYKPGSLVVAMYGATIGKVGMLSIETTTNQACCVIEKNSFINMKYVFYLFLGFREKIISMAYGGGQPNISQDLIKSLRLPFPDKKEQTAIASFLDQKTTQLDQAIAIKEKQITLLKERKQILIQNAVTRGLNPDAPMRDSGVVYIGEIPAHWMIKRLKYILDERNERSKTGEEPLFMVSQVHGLVVRSEYHNKAEVAESNVDNKIVYINDLVFNKLKAHLGVFFKSNISFKGLVSPDYAVYKPKGFIKDLKLLEYLFRHPAYIGQFIIRATGIVEGLIRLYTDDLFDIYVPVPPTPEQQIILQYIETESSKINKAITIQQQQIEKLKEYKTTLINSAVTGKIKVA